MRSFTGKCRQPLSLAVIFVALILLLFPTGRTHQVHAASISVSGSCTLADAITAANTDTATGNCPAGNGADTITLTADVTLPSADSDVFTIPRSIFTPVAAAIPIITSNITLEGGGYSISGNEAYRILHINSGTVNINNVTLTKGRADLGEGGAIYVTAGASLTVTNSSFTHNWAYWGGAIYSNGTLSVSNSIFESNTGLLQAGAIKNPIGTVTVSSSRFSNNYAHDNSGAIANGHILTITQQHL